MRKIILIFILACICVLLTGCDDRYHIGSTQLRVIEQNGEITLCYDEDTYAVYIVYSSPYKFGISPYIVFDEFNRPTVGKWNGQKITVAKTEDLLE